MTTLAELAWFHHYVALTEILWTLFGLIGMYFVVHNYKEISCDIDALESSHTDGTLLAIAHAHLRTEVFRGFLNSITAISGFVAMITPPVEPRHPINFLQVLFTMVVFLFSVVTVAQSALDRRLRKTIQSGVLDEHEEVTK